MVSPVPAVARASRPWAENQGQDARATPYVDLTSCSSPRAQAGRFPLAANSAQFADESPIPSDASIFEDVYFEVDRQTEAGRTGKHFFND